MMYIVLIPVLVSLFQYHRTDYNIVQDILDMKTELAMLQDYLHHSDQSEYHYV